MHATTDRGRSPLTDPRALATSVLLHAALLLIASAIVLGATLPRGASTPPKALRADFGPVDNRAPVASSGGSAGLVGGKGEVESSPVNPDGPSGEPTIDALLAQAISPSAAPSIGPSARKGSGASMGVGALPGPGTGGGGGSGTGSGGGAGKGAGPGTDFFGARDRGRSFAYVIDCSGSMSDHGALDVAKRELIASLGKLPPEARFGVVFYNWKATVFPDPSGRPGLMAATLEAKGRVRARLREIPADGGTNHMNALRAALAFQPEVLFFLTDADMMTPREADEILAEAGKTRIQSIEFGVGPDVGVSAPLRKLASGTGGTYRYLDVTTFGRVGE